MYACLYTFQVIYFVVTCFHANVSFTSSSDVWYGIEIDFLSLMRKCIVSFCIISPIRTTIVLFDLKSNGMNNPNLILILMK